MIYLRKSDKHDATTEAMKLVFRRRNSTQESKENMRNTM